MARKDGYQVNQVVVLPSSDFKDRSFVLCLGSLLAFFVFCLIVIFAITLPGGSKSAPEPTSMSKNELLQGGIHTSTPEPSVITLQRDPIDHSLSEVSEAPVDLTSSEPASTTIDLTSSEPSSSIPTISTTVAPDRIMQETDYVYHDMDMENA